MPKNPRTLYNSPKSRASSAPAQLSLLLFFLDLQRRQLKHLAHTPLNLLPPTKLNLRRPCQDANPGLHIIMNLQHHVIRFRDLARRSRNLVFCFLILELDLAPVLHQALSSFPFPKFDSIKTYLDGSTLLPFALLINFFIATGPIFCRWSADGFVIIVSQITASFVSSVDVELGHEADT